VPSEEGGISRYIRGGRRDGRQHQWCRRLSPTGEALERMELSPSTNPHCSLALFVMPPFVFPAGACVCVICVGVPSIQRCELCRTLWRSVMAPQT